MQFLMATQIKKQVKRKFYAMYSRMEMLGLIQEISLKLLMLVLLLVKNIISLLTELAILLDGDQKMFQLMRLVRF